MTTANKFEKILLDTIICSCKYCENKDQIYYEIGEWDKNAIRIGCLCGDVFQNKVNRTDFLTTEKAIDEWNSLRLEGV